MYVGIIHDPLDSLFTYGRNGGWQTFYKPGFVPLFQVTFRDPVTEEEAIKVYMSCCLVCC